MLQQYLPFTVLKLIDNPYFGSDDTTEVATVLTVYGIETEDRFGCPCEVLRYVATVLTVYGIETVF